MAPVKKITSNDDRRTTLSRGDHRLGKSSDRAALYVRTLWILNRGISADRNQNDVILPRQKLGIGATGTAGGEAPGINAQMS